MVELPLARLYESGFSGMERVHHATDAILCAQVSLDVALD